MAGLAPGQPILIDAPPSALPLKKIDELLNSPLRNPMVPEVTVLVPSLIIPVQLRAVGSTLIVKW